MRKLNAAAVAVLLLAAGAAQAGEVYGGIGFPGLTLGYGQALSDSTAVRGEFSGGLSMSRNGEREGVRFEGKLKANTLSVLGDWYPTASGFRLTGGLSLSDTSVKLKSSGGTATINGIAVNLDGRAFNVDLDYPKVTPYVGIGYGSHPKGAKGWGFYADVGVLLGKFNTQVSQNVVGVNGITQADVDAQVKKVQDDVNKLSVLPKFSVGVSYRF